MRSPNTTESNSASDASTDHCAVRAKSDSPGDRGEAIVTVSNGGRLEGTEVTNNGILDVTSGGQLNANLIQDNLLRSSSGVEDLVINGNLTVNTAGFGFDYIIDNGTLVSHDKYIANGDIVLNGIMFILANDIDALDGLSANLLSGNNITTSESFAVRLVELDANSLNSVNNADFLAVVANESIELQYTTENGSLTVDFSGIGANATQARIVGTSTEDGSSAMF